MEGAVLGGGPGGDGPLREGAGAVGEDEVGVEVDGVAEALATRAGAVGIVEGEETGLRLAVGAMAGGALECGGEAEMLRRCLRFQRRSFDCVGLTPTSLRMTLLSSIASTERGRVWNWTSPDSR